MDDEQQETLVMLESVWAHAARRLQEQDIAPEAADPSYVRLLLEEAGGTMDGNFFTGAFCARTEPVPEICARAPKSARRWRLRPGSDQAGLRGNDPPACVVVSLADRWTNGGRTLRPCMTRSPSRCWSGASMFGAWNTPGLCRGSR